MTITRTALNPCKVVVDGPTAQRLVIECPDVKEVEELVGENAALAGMGAGGLETIFEELLSDLCPAHGRTGVDQANAAKRRDRQIFSMIERDSVYERGAYLPIYSAWADVAKQTLAEPLRKASVILGNDDLKSDRALTRASELILPSLAKFSDGLRLAFDKIAIPRWTQFELVIRNSVGLPVPEAPQDVMRQELRAAEVRAHFRGLGKSERLAELHRLVQTRGAVEAFAALVDDPLGRDDDREFMRRIRTTLARQLDPALGFWLDTEPDLLIGAATRGDLLYLVAEQIGAEMLHSAGDARLAQRPNLALIAESFVGALKEDFDLKS